MPVARRYQSSVSPSALPGVRRSPIETDESTGATVSRERARTAQTAAGLAGQVAQTGLSLYEREQRRKQQEQERAAREAKQQADQLAVLRARRELNDYELATLEDPQSGILNLQGEQVFDAPTRVRDGFKKTADAIEARLSPDQRAAFQEARIMQGMRLDTVVQRHVSNAIGKYEDDEISKSVAAHVNLMGVHAQDPARAALELDAAVTEMRAHMQKRGLGPKVIEDAVLQTQTSGHLAVINRLMSIDRDKDAETYFSRAKSQMSTDAVADVQAKLEIGTRRAEAQKAAAEIVRAGGSLSEQLEKVGQIEDAKLQDDVRDRVKTQYQERTAQQKADEEASLTNIYNYLDGRGATFDGMQRLTNSRGEVIWGSLTGAQRSAAKNYLEDKIRGVPVKTDIRKWDELMNLAMSNPEKFATTPLIGYRNVLDEGDYKQLKGLQLSVIKGDRTEADRNLKSYRTATAIVRDTLEGYGLSFRDTEDAPMTPDNRRIIDQVTRATTQYAEDYQVQTGKAAPDSDVQRFVDRLMAPMAGGDSNFTPRLARIRFEDIPENDKALIRDAWKRRYGSTPSESDILTIFILHKAGR
jgi:hypothetical protein